MQSAGGRQAAKRRRPPVCESASSSSAGAVEDASGRLASQVLAFAPWHEEVWLDRALAEEEAEVVTEVNAESVLVDDSDAEMELMSKKRLDKKVIEASSETFIYQKKSSGTEEAAATCGICCEDFRPKQKLRVLCCIHRFHRSCVDRWLRTHRDCPECRFDVEKSAKLAARATKLPRF